MLILPVPSKQFSVHSVHSVHSAIGSRMNGICHSENGIAPKRTRILGLQPRDKAAMLVVNRKEMFLINLHQNRVHFPEERDAFVLDHQHGCRDVTCKPAIPSIQSSPIPE